MTLLTDLPSCVIYMASVCYCDQVSIRTRDFQGPRGPAWLILDLIEQRKHMFLHGCLSLLAAGGEIVPLSAVTFSV